MAQDTGIRIALPTQDLDDFPHFALDGPSAREWADGLPVTNIQYTAARLRDALRNLNRVALAPTTRQVILEGLRRVTLSTLTLQASRYLGQPLMLEEQSRQQAVIAGELMDAALAGHTLVAVHTIRDPDSIRDQKPARLVCEALQRALYYAGERVLQSLQLYQPTEAQTWSTLHRLYALAERQQVATVATHDTLLEGEFSAIQHYLTPLLVACAKPNQLRQGDITTTYLLMRRIGRLAALRDPSVSEGLFLVNLASDRPPTYAALEQDPVTSHHRFLDTSALVGYLRDAHRPNQAGHRTVRLDPDGPRLDVNLVEHLARYLGEVTQRNFSRHADGGTLRIVIGLGGVHFHVAGGLTLEQVLHGSHYTPSRSEAILSNPFLGTEGHRDRWQGDNPHDTFVREEQASSDPASALGFDPGVLAEHTPDTRPGAPPEAMVSSAVVLNSSPRGYCIEWDDKPPADARVGDLVCVREDDGPATATWAIASIRWISQIENAPTYMGLELLSPRATPYAARVKTPDGGESLPIRVLLLPQIKLVGQPHTLICPRLVFHENQRILIQRREDSFLIRLKRQVMSTPTFSQYDFEYLRTVDQGDERRENRTPGTSSPFQSIWSDL